MLTTKSTKSPTMSLMCRLNPSFSDLPLAPEKLEALISLDTRVQGFLFALAAFLTYQSPLPILFSLCYWPTSQWNCNACSSEWCYFCHYLYHSTHTTFDLKLKLVLVLIQTSSDSLSCYSNDLIVTTCSLVTHLLWHIVTAYFVGLLPHFFVFDFTSRCCEFKWKQS